MLLSTALAYKIVTRTLIFPGSLPGPQVHKIVIISNEVTRSFELCLASSRGSCRLLCCVVYAGQKICLYCIVVGWGGGGEGEVKLVSVSM